MESSLPGVKVVIMTKLDWTSYKDENATILSQLNSLLVLLVTPNDIFNIEKYA